MNRKVKAKLLLRYAQSCDSRSAFMMDTKLAEHELDTFVSSPLLTMVGSACFKMFSTLERRNDWSFESDSPSVANGKSGASGRFSSSSSGVEVEVFDVVDDGTAGATSGGDPSPPSSSSS